MGFEKVASDARIFSSTWVGSVRDREYSFRSSLEVANDEELARRGIELRLASHPDISIVQQCVNGREGLQAKQQTKYPHILPIRDDSGTVRLDVTTIDWIDAAGDYMCVHADGRTYVLRETMKSLEAVLDPEIFQRVHRSTIVNVQRVRRLRSQRRIFPDPG